MRSWTYNLIISIILKCLSSTLAKESGNHNLQHTLQLKEIGGELGALSLTPPPPPVMTRESNKTLALRYKSGSSKSLVETAGKKTKNVGGEGKNGEWA